MSIIEDQNAMENRRLRREVDALVEAVATLAAENERLLKAAEKETNA